MAEGLWKHRALQAAEKIGFVSHDCRAVRGHKNRGASTRRFPPCNLQKQKILTPNVCHSERRAQHDVASCHSTAGRGARNLCISALCAVAISGDREIKGYTP